MRKLTWDQYCKECEKNRTYLRNLIIKLYKTPGNSVLDNTILMVEEQIEENNTFTLDDSTIDVSSENVEVTYLCDDIEELERFKKHDNIKSINNLEVIFLGVVNTYKVTFNNVLADVLTSNEAAELYGVTEGTLRSAMKSGKLKFGTDYRKAGRITLITKEAMKKKYSK